MRIQIIQRQGYVTREGLEFAPMSIVELDDHVAAKLIQYGIAAPAPKPKLETAAKAAPKTNTVKLSGKAEKRSAPAVKKEDEHA